MASRTCWNCGKDSHHTKCGDLVSPGRRDGTWSGLFQCDNCGFCSLGMLTLSDTFDLNNAQAALRNGADVSWLPERFSGKPYPDVPGHIASAASEAHTCYSAGAYRGAIMLARAVVEATAKDKGATSGTLAAKIQKLYDENHIRELIRDTADEIRYLGNDMAHGDFIDAVTSVDAEDVLAFMAEVLDEVYQAPARVNARREQRLARKAASEE